MEQVLSAELPFPAWQQVCLAVLLAMASDSVDEELDGEIAESKTTAMEYAKLAKSADTELAEVTDSRHV